MIRRLLLGLLFILFAAACSPASEESLAPLPTLASLDTPVQFDSEAAGRAALGFLDAWQRGDFDTMYSLIAFSSQEANPKDTFVTLYQSSQSQMTLQSLHYSPVTLYPQRSDVAVLNYNITFTTNLLGEFSDDDRDLQLIFDPRAADWRVAWTPGDIFAEMADGGRLRLEISPPSRANIYDHADNILADQNGRVVVVKAIKQAITDWPTCLSLLAPAMVKDPADVQKIYDESSPDWLMELGTMEPAAYDQNHTQLEQVCAAQFSSRPTRRYINGTIAPNIVGSVGYPDEADLPAIEAAGFDRDSILGKSGIEKSWDEKLRGHPGGRLLIVTPSGTVAREIARTASNPAESVWLTIDSDMQAGVMKILSDAYAANKDGWGSTSKGAAAVVIDVNTGNILAMVSYPTYDDNAFAPFPSMSKTAADQIVAQLQSDPRRPLLNRPTQGAYPLGSVMKAVSAAAVADSGVYALDQRYTCTGIWTRDIPRTDWLAGGHGTLTLPQALTQSCDPYFYEVGYQLDQFDHYALPSYARRMGLGGPTGLKDIAEATGLIIDPDWKKTNLGIDWTFSDAVNMSIGQGEVLVTPLQVARLFAAIANGGTLYRPQLVEKTGILGEAPSFVSAPDPMTNFNIKPEVLDVVREGLCNVTVSHAGTAEYQFRAYPDLQRLGVCGKTGTAQDGPADAASHAWFAAYAPKDNPQIAVAVIVENSGEGSGVAAPIVRDIMRYYFFERP
ncbi:MAG: penicillin-binding transpeptidase domain-containing protein [Chloroflexota bacterium]